MNESEEKKINGFFDNFVIATMSRSDNELAKHTEPRCTSQALGTYRRGSAPSQKFIESNTAKIYLSNFPSGLRGGGPIYVALRDYCIKKMVNNQKDDEINEFINCLDEEIKFRPNMVASLSHLKATTWIISNPSMGEFLKYKQAIKIHENLDLSSSDKYWTSIIDAQEIFIDYKMMKYFKDDDVFISKDDAESLLLKSKKTAENLNTLSFWINHLEVCSVAEDLNELLYADSHVSKLIGIENDSYAPNKIKYLWGSVFRHLDLRDGKKFRTTHENELKVLSYE